VILLIPLFDEHLANTLSLIMQPELSKAVGRRTFQNTFLLIDTPAYHADDEKDSKCERNFRLD
jgi:hypothetical protein